MQKWMLGLLVFLILAAAFIYGFIPSRLVFSRSLTIEAHQRAVFRSLTQQHLIEKWWQAQEKQEPGTTGFIDADGYSFRLQPGAFDIITVHSRKGTASLPPSYISVTPLQKHVSLVEWKFEQASGTGPLQRVRNYLHAKGINNRMAAVFDSLQHFMQDAENVYGIRIENTRVSDTLLITSRRETAAIPGTADYYSMIDSLEAYIKSRGAVATNYPMLHIVQTDRNNYQTTVAIPVNKIVPDEGNIRLNRMIPGNILTAEVRGGLHTVMNAMQQMEYFASENSLASPAMPYQQLITNRLLQPDSSKWITRIYYPVI